MNILVDPEQLKLKCEVCKPNDRSVYKDLINKMKAFVLEKDGMGLAAPQVGIQKRFFVLRTRSNLVISVFNPTISFHSKEVVETNESCFSCPGVIKKTARPALVKVSYHDSLWRPQKRSFVSIHSVAFQHELDHLNGILISD